MRSESLHQRTPQQAGQPNSVSSMRGPAQPAPATLLERYESWMSSVDHPDLSVFREMVKNTSDRPLDYSEMENQVFSLFKDTRDFAILKYKMIDAVDQLASLFDKVPVEATIMKKRLIEILNRATITADSSPQDFGNQKTNIIQLTCLRFKQLAAIVRQLQYAKPVDIDVKSYLEHVKDCVKNIAAEYSVCGPGVVQKAEDEFSQLRLKLFPPSIDRAVTETKNYLVKQIVIDFCNRKYGFNNTARDGNAIPIGNQIHYVAAWQDRLIESYPEFAHIPKSDDPFAPRLPHDGPHTLLMQELMRDISRGATEVHACRFLAESAFQKIRSHLGEKVENINDNFGAFNEVLQQIQARFPCLAAEHFLQTDDLFNYRMRDNADHVTLSLLQALPAERFCPVTVWKAEGLQLKTFGDLAWLESVGSTPTETEVDFDFTPSSFFRNLDATRSDPSERILQLLPVISRWLLGANPADRAEFFSQVLQKGFGTNLIQQIGFSLESLQSETDAALFIVASLQLIANQSKQASRDDANTLRDLLRWHDNTNAICKYFGNPTLVLDLLSHRFSSITSIKDISSFLINAKNPHLAYALLAASRSYSSKGGAVSRFVGIDPWAREVTSLKREAKQNLKTPAYLASKAAQSNAGGQELKSLSPRALLDILILEKTDCLDFALKHGLSPDAKIKGNGSLRPFNGNSLLQIAIQVNNVGVVDLLLRCGATREQSCQLDGRLYDARQYLELVGRELPNYRQMASILDGHDVGRVN